MVAKKGSGDGYGTEFGGEVIVKDGAKVAQGPIVQDTDRVKRIQELLEVEQSGRLDAKTRQMLQVLDGGLHEQDGFKAKGFDKGALDKLKEVGGDKGKELAQLLEGMKKDGTLFYNPREEFKFEFKQPAAGPAPKEKIADATPDDHDAPHKKIGKPVPVEPGKDTPTKPGMGIVNLAEILAHAMIEETRLRERYEKLRDAGTAHAGDLDLADKALKEQMAIYDKVKGLKNGDGIIKEAQRIYQELDTKYDQHGIDKRHVEVMRDVHKMAGDGGPKVSPVAGTKTLVEDFTVRPVTIKTPTSDGDKPSTVTHAGSVGGLTTTGGKGLDEVSQKFVSAFLQAAEAIGFAARKPEVKAELAISNASTLG